MKVRQGKGRPLRCRADPLTWFPAASASGEVCAWCAVARVARDPRGELVVEEGRRGEAGTVRGGGGAAGGFRERGERWRLLGALLVCGGEG